ncbi:uncharacterized protein FA14DRAFT_159327 [Meira miltonrushii]|uniref:Uncharacterized protein n=1 Tax=Meira miltonrushii TaxID=1280837 RepID=A0A316VHY2_9BASI|nr:uncharacterized protein FA14DRAFT_159327 [Meira miltonrushii]PWN37146.1 hypothetical protein FA14DRAFT_159327 [Meira miltonrushii]
MIATRTFTFLLSTSFPFPFLAHNYPSLALYMQNGERWNWRCIPKLSDDIQAKEAAMHEKARFSEIDSITT